MTALQKGPALRLQHSLARQIGNPLAELQPPRHHIAVHDLPHDPQLLRLLRLDYLAR